MGVVVVVALIPITLMVVVCLLERLEALALPSRRRARPIRALPASPPRGPHLAVVPTAAPPAPGRIPGLDGDTLDLRRAS